MKVNKATIEKLMVDTQASEHELTNAVMRYDCCKSDEEREALFHEISKKRGGVKEGTQNKSLTDGDSKAAGSDGDKVLLSEKDKAAPPTGDKALAGGDTEAPVSPNAPAASFLRSDAPASPTPAAPSAPTEGGTAKPQ